jgi:hypothetical protein
MPHMTGEDWQRLVGTTAEWLFLGQVLVKAVVVMAQTKEGYFFVL